MTLTRRGAIVEMDLGNLLFTEENKTLNGRENFRSHPEIWCLDFKPQYLLYYSRPTNVSYTVRVPFIACSKKTIRCFKLISELLCWLRTLRQNIARLVSRIVIHYVSKHATAAATQPQYQWDKVATNGNQKNRKFAL